MYCAPTAIVITVFNCTRFLLYFNLIFSYLATQAQVRNKAQFSTEFTGFLP